MNSIIEKCMDYSTDNLLYSPSRKKLYHYDESNTIWSAITKDDFDTYMYHLINNIITKWLLEEQMILEKANTIPRVIHTCYSMYKKRNDDAIISQFNRKKGVLPLTDNQVIEFTTLQKRPRVRTDYFTTYCPINYDPHYNKDKIYRIIATICTTTYKKNRDPTEAEMDAIMTFIKRFGYLLTGENHASVQEFEENENNEHQLVSEQRLKRKQLQEQYKIYTCIGDAYVVEIFLTVLEYYLGELYNNEIEHYVTKHRNEQLHENHYRIVLLSSKTIDAIGPIQGCVPIQLLKQGQLQSSSWYKINPITFYIQDERIYVSTIYNDFFSACCEGAFMYYQELAKE